MDFLNVKTDRIGHDGKLVEVLIRKAAIVCVQPTVRGFAVCFTHGALAKSLPVDRREGERVKRILLGKKKVAKSVGKKTISGVDVQGRLAL